jgi:NAD(P)-dependent dehydrogenase (short-subunit alcohol dehydrogenase family)
MEPLRFDGRVAIVTGAGGNPSLGRAYALLLAERGAKVVVNDIGRDPETPGYTGTASAEAVVEDIRAAGGTAVADTHSVASEDGGAAIVETALSAFGRLDILVNNAGLSIAAPFEAMTARDLQRHIDVNVMGSIWTCRAAWPHMRKGSYGRIVNTTSGAMAGFNHLVAYGASKGALFSLSRALAAEGAPLGINVNAIAPGAFTRMVAAQQEESSPLYGARDGIRPELCAPALAWLVHERCTVTGDCIETVGGAVHRFYFGQTAGIVDPAMTIETVAARWDAIIAGTPEGAIPFGATDPTEWSLRPYAPQK